GAQPLELAPKLDEIVDFTVEDNRDLSRGIAHRLVPSGRQINDREAPKREPYATICRPPLAGIVRPAVRHRVTARDEPGSISYGRYGRDTYEAAHGLASRKIGAIGPAVKRTC